MTGPAASEVANQLHMFHNPFANKTSQPKIPDGKVNDSLGFQTQAVGELEHDGTGTIHLMLYPGMTSGMIVQNVTQKGLTRNYFIPEYVGSNALDWSTAVDPPANCDIRQPEYSQWRLVSQGLQLKLLNSVEEDDGWWEAVRVNTAFNKTWFLSTQNNSTNREADGTMAPFFAGYTDDNLVNEASYSTGLLRDLHRVQFELHGRQNYHDMINLVDELWLQAEGQESVDLTSYEMFLNTEFDGVQDMINYWTDQSYDAMYIRIHPRGTAPDTKLHYNLVSNQEITFDNNQRESRFHTKSHNAGLSAMGMHAAARRGDQNAAKMVYS